MRQPLFLDTPVHEMSFDGAEKYAGAFTPLGDNVDDWPREILVDAYRQLPYLSEFAVDIGIDRTDEENGFAFGSLVVRPVSQMTTSEESERPLPTVHIPIVVRDRKMAPLDLFALGKRYHPLTEGRLREALFRPDMFDAARERPWEPNMYADLQPPLASSSGIGGGGVKLGEDTRAKEMSMGLKEEKEHDKGDRFDIFPGRSATKEELGRIAGAHLNEDPHYYSKLERAMGGGEKTSGLLGALGRKAPTYVPVDKIRKGMEAVHDVSRVAGSAAAPKASAIAAAAKPLRSAAEIRGVKMAQKLAVLSPLLPKLAGQVKQDHVDRLRQTIVKDASIRSALMNAHPGVQAAFASAMGLDVSNLEKSAQLAWSMVPPTVVQLQKLANGNFKVKWANAEVYDPQAQEIDPITARELIGDLDSVARLEEDGTITVSPDAAVKQTLDSEEIKAVDSFGLWCVQDTNGTDITGWCFPTLLSFDMQPLPLTLFTNGSQYAIQEKIAGVMIGKSTELPKGQPRGFGCFYYIDHGTARAFVPMSINHVVRSQDGMQYVGVLETGEQVTLHLADHTLQTVQRVGQNEYAIPGTMSWLPLRGQTELQSEPMLVTKVAAVSIGEVISDGTYYTFRGPAFAKVANHHKSGLTRHEAEFFGVASGLHEHFVKKALDQTHTGNIVKLGGLRLLGNAAEKLQEAKIKIAAELKSLDHPIRNYNLIKEAATMMDAMTADKILGLGFINPENISAFVDSLPSLDICSQKLAEMLLAVRLGMAGPPELALERALVALEDVIQGLRRLRQRDTSFRSEN